VKLLGEGGFASVYLGQHVQIVAQQVAIKVLHLTQVNTQQFRQEAETTAALKHPHIVRLLDFAIEQGTPFLVLDYAFNGSLRTRHALGEPLPLATIIECVTQIADALQYAHDKHHIIHRDIKPDNVLIDQHGSLLLSDFGIAVISKTGRTTRSVAHGITGTPYYMAPEMFRGKPEKASDQYSLAVMAYQWLGGTLPFREGNFIQLGYQHGHVPVPPLRDKVPTISADVEAVIMRALSKEPQDRFASVREFAEALEAASKKPAIGQQLGNYRLIELLGEGGFASVYLGQHVNIATQQAAIKVLHLAGIDQQKFQREAETIAALRHPHIVRLLDFAFQSGTGIPFLVLDYALNGSLRTRHADGERLPLATVVQYVMQIADALQYAHDKHHIIHCDIKPDNVLIDQQGELLLSDFGIAVMSQTGRTTVQSTADLLGTPAYMAPEMFTAQPVFASDQYALAVMVYQWLSGTLPFGEGDFYQLGYQHTHEPVPLLRDKVPAILVAMEAVVLKGLAKQPQDRFPSVYAFAEALDSASKKPPIGTRLLTYRGHNDALGETCAWSPDGTRLATGGSNGLLKIWDARTGQLILTCEDCCVAPINAVAWSPGGRRLASASGDKIARVWDVSSGQCILSFNGHSRAVNAVAWSPDGRRLASASEDHTVQVWDAASGNLFLSFNGHSDAVNAVAWSPDGHRLASASGSSISWNSMGKSVQVWDAASGKTLLSFNGHPRAVNAVAWSPDGHRLASTSNYHTVQVWDAASGKALLSFNGHSDDVNAVAWSPDGRCLASASGSSGWNSMDKSVQVWDAASGKALLSFNGHSRAVNAVAWSPDGHRLASTSDDDTVQVWDAASGKALLSFNGHSNPVQAVVWSPDGRRLASASASGSWGESDDHTVQVWDAASGKTLLSFNGHSRTVNAVAWSPDGYRLATASDDHTVQVWDAVSGKALLSFNFFNDFSDTMQVIMVWSPDGRRLAFTYDFYCEDECYHTVQVCDATNGKTLFSYEDHSTVQAVAWSPDGRRLATASDDHMVQVCDATNGEDLLSFNGHSRAVNAVAWSPDGRRLATASDDHTVQVWDTASGTLLHTYDDHGYYVNRVAWSPDGTCIASGAHNGVVVVWQAV
ncbi:MAG TPA: protein kinase, partial [Ktedonobacteraceae bacterium]